MATTLIYMCEALTTLHIYMCFIYIFAKVLSLSAYSAAGAAIDSIWNVIKIS